MRKSVDDKVLEGEHIPASRDYELIKPIIFKGVTMEVGAPVKLRQTQADALRKSGHIK